MHKIMYVNNLFSANVCQCNITYSVVHVELCFKSFLFIIIILYLCFQLVYSKYSPDTENYVWERFLKRIRTFEAEILKMFKENI